MEKQYKRGSIYLARLGAAENSEQNGVRPVLIISNDVGNKAGPTVIVAAITSKLDKPSLPTHVFTANDCGLRDDSIILLEQIRTLDKRRLGRHIGNLKDNTMKEVNDALVISVGI